MAIVNSKLLVIPTIFMDKSTISMAMFIHVQ